MSQVIQEDEIDLRELFLTLKKKKKLIIAMTSVITLLAIIFVLLKQPIYEVKSNVLVGFIEKMGESIESKKTNIDNPEVIAKKLRVIFNVDDRLESKEKFVSQVSDISVSKKLKDFIIIKTQGISNDEAKKLNKKVVKYLVDMYKPKITQYISNQKNKIKVIREDIKRVDNFDIKNIKKEITILKTQKIATLNEKIDFLKKVTLPSINNKIKIHETKIDEYNKILEKLYKNASSNGDSTTQAILSMQMLNYQNLILNSQNKLEDLKVKKRDINEIKIINLQRERDNISGEEIRKLQYKIDVDLRLTKKELQNNIDNITYNISEQNIQNSKVIGEYIFKKSPIKPKKKLIVIVAFITGLMLSIFLVFLLEFISSFKEEDK